MALFVAFLARTRYQGARGIAAAEIQRRGSRTGSGATSSSSFHLQNVPVSPDKPISSSSCVEIMINVADFFVRRENFWAAIC